MNWKIKKWAVSVFVLLHKIGTTFSLVPPTGKTGAPGEETCYTAGCHLLDELNPPNASIDIVFNNGANSYKPDTVYDVSLTVTDSSMKIFGFQMTALDSNNLRMGDFVILDSLNTYIQLAGAREYVSHYGASNPNNVGAGFFTWQFQWIAPSVNVGPIRLYAAGVSADSPISAPAGNVHTTSLSVFQATTVGFSKYPPKEHKLTVFPNPADQYIRFIFNDNQWVVDQVMLYSITGQISFRYSGEQIQEQGIDVSAVPSGSYLIKVSNELHKRIIIIH